jgi:hypothetical protein
MKGEKFLAISILFEMMLMYTNKKMVQHGMEGTSCIRDKGLDERRDIETSLGLVEAVRVLRLSFKIMGMTREAYQIFGSCSVCFILFARLELGFRARFGRFFGTLFFPMVSISG